MDCKRMDGCVVCEKRAGLHNQIGIMYGTTNCSYQRSLLMLMLRLQWILNGGMDGRQRMHLPDYRVWLIKQGTTVLFGDFGCCIVYLLISLEISSSLSVITLMYVE